MYYGTPPIVTNGLVLNLDAANTLSYVSGSTIWRDTSGRGNNGTLTNGPTFSRENGGSIVFDGVNDFIQINNSDSLNFNTGNFTILCWVSGISVYPGSNRSIIWKGSRFDSNLPGWSMTWAGLPQDLYFIISSDSARLEGRTNPNFDLNGWSGYKMVGMQRSESSWRQINNTVITNLGTFAGDVDNSSPIYIARNGHYNAYLNNIVSTTLIYNRALTPQEVLQNYNALKSRFNLT